VIAALEETIAVQEIAKQRAVAKAELEVESAKRMCENEKNRGDALTIKLESFQEKMGQAEMEKATMQEEQVRVKRQAAVIEREALMLKMELKRLNTRIVKPIMAVGRQAKGRRKNSLVSNLMDPEKVGHVVRSESEDGELAGRFFAMLKDNFLYLFDDMQDNMPQITVALEGAICAAESSTSFSIVTPSLRKHLLEVEEGNPDKWLLAFEETVTRHVLSPSPDGTGGTRLCPPTWVPDVDVAACFTCDKAFTFYRAKHHCRCCGRIYCHDCCGNRMPLPEYGYDEKVRVCNTCAVEVNTMSEDKLAHAVSKVVDENWDEEEFKLVGKGSASRRGDF